MSQPPNSQFDEENTLKEPLSNSDGSLNQDCMAELSEVVANIPKAHDRLSIDPEWSAKRITSKKDILGGFVKYAVRQSPYDCPDHIQEVVLFLAKCLDRDVKWDDMGFAYLSLCEINKLLYDILYEKGVSYFDAWNKSKITRSEDLFFTSAYSNHHPDTDFIDLDALLRNVCIDIRTDRREFDAFNKKFDEENGIKSSGQQI